MRRTAAFLVGIVSSLVAACVVAAGALALILGLRGLL